MIIKKKKKKRSNCVKRWTEWDRVMNKDEIRMKIVIYIYFSTAFYRYYNCVITTSKSQPSTTVESQRSGVNNEGNARKQKWKLRDFLCIETKMVRLIYNRATKKKKQRMTIYRIRIMERLIVSIQKYEKNIIAMIALILLLSVCVIMRMWYAC